MKKEEKNIKTDLKVLILNDNELHKLIYNKYGELKDDSVFSRIRFFSYFDFRNYEKEPYFVVLIKNKLIIGVAKIAYYSASSKNENNYSISFCSIDKNYRSLGYSKLIVNEIFKEAKIKKYEISTSSYTVLGKEYLQKQFNKYSNIHNVIFHDKTDEYSLIDTENMYKIENGKKIHKFEIEDDGLEFYTTLKSLLSQRYGI